MSKKKKDTVSDGASTTSSQADQAQRPESSLTISRNKHWRYISAFHGPWLQLPHEILETLAHSNFLSPKPRQTDPGVLFDLLKIRKLVDDAADLAVRAQNGTASSALSNDNGLPGGSLGFSSGRGGAGAKLSPERKYRMRELATSKLALAYRLDEVAASVATMQSASALDTVAMLVLQRNPANTDAKYVKFFHEKIPSRMMAECTPLTPLNEIVANEPGHAQAAVLRTRALTRIFKEDHAGAVSDLTESLAICRLEMGKQKNGRQELVRIADVKDEAERRRMWTRDWVHENKVSEEDQPRGMEMQLLFQRGNQYLTLACQFVRTALEHFKAAQRAQESNKEDTTEGSEADAPECTTSVESEAYRRALEARENIRKYAKRALKDYTTFLGHLDYAHAPAQEAGELNGNAGNRPSPLDLAALNGPQEAPTTALVRRERTREASPISAHWTSYAEPTVYDIATLLLPAPPASLPPFPPPAAVSTALVCRSDASSTPHAAAPEHQNHETITYHPLLPETLHALLLAHALLQTPPTTLYRIANNVARLARLADGYPFFLSARSPARADWAEILRKTGNWIGLAKTWEGLLKLGTNENDSKSRDAAGMNGKTGGSKKPSTTTKNKSKDKLNGTTTATAATSSSTTLAKSNGTTASSSPSTVIEDGKAETNQALRDRIHKEAVIEALGDERVVDDDTFQRAVEAREKRAWREMIEDRDVQPEGPRVVEVLDDDEDNVDGRKEDGIAEAGGEGANVANGTNGTNGTTADGESVPPHPAAPAEVTHTPSSSAVKSTTAADLSTTTKATSPAPAPAPAPKPKSNTTPTKTTGPPPVAKDEEYLIGTERASAIAAWVLEAPVTVDLSLLNGGKAGKPRRKKKPAHAHVASAVRLNGA